MKINFRQIFFLLLFSFLFAGISRAQEENYEQTPVKKTPVLNDTMPAPESSSSSEAEKQKEKPASNKKFDPKKLRIGINNFGFQIGTYYNYNFIFLEASPTVGYLFLKDHLELGTGPIFIYQRYKEVYTERKYNLFTYGASFYTRGYVWKGLFLQAQYDLVNKPSIYDFTHRLNVNHLLLGAGYSTPIGETGSFFISALFNVLNNPESIYRGTFGDFPLILNIGFGFGTRGRH